MARRGTKLGIGLGVTLLVLLGALVIADRVAASVAEDRIAAEAKKELVARDITAPSDPRVSIGGFPFLTQVLAGTYQNITINFDRPETNGVQLRDLKVVATSVRADTQDVMNGTGTVTAGQVTGTVNLDWEAVRGLIQLAKLPNIDPKNIQLTVVNNRIEARFPLSFAGQSVTLRATGGLEVSEGKVRVQLDDLATEGSNLPPALNALARNYIQQNRSALAGTINVPEMPYKLVIKKVETSDAGVLMIAAADNVVLAG